MGYSSRSVVIAVVVGGMSKTETPFCSCVKENGCLYGGIITSCNLPFVRNLNMPMTEGQRVQRRFRHVFNTREYPKDIS